MHNNTGSDRFSEHCFCGKTGLAAKLSEKKTIILEENKLVLLTDFEDMIALEDKKGLTVFLR